MIGVKQEELQGLVWAAIWRRYLLYDGGQDSIQPPSYNGFERNGVVLSRVADLLGRLMYTTQ